MSKRKRRWFQIHLSTAIVLMFVAGCLVWANVSTVRKSSNIEFEFGWPSSWYWRGYIDGEYDPSNIFWEKYLVFDALIILAILGAVAFACEWRIRREARKP